MIILGINAYHGDASAALVRDGNLIAAVEEERFNRCKHCAGFPTQSIHYCLEAAGVSIEDVEHVGISRDPSAHLHKKIVFTALRAARKFRGRDKAKPKSEDKRGTGVFRQVADRLANAARVRELRKTGLSARIPHL
jgi:predicted NodU family carbamoyl transferase